LDCYRQWEQESYGNGQRAEEMPKLEKKDRKIKTRYIRK